MSETGFEKAFLISIALLATAACDRSRRVYVAHAAEPSPRAVRIGAFASLTGQDAASGADYQRGFELAIDAWNAGEGARRLRVELVTYDDQSRPSASAVAVHRLLDDDRVALVACSRFPYAQEIVTTTEAIFVCASCPDDARRNVIGVAPSVQARAELLAELVVKSMDLNRVAVLARHGVEADRAAGDAFRASLKSRGVAAQDTLTFTPETIADVLAKLASNAPQAVLVAMDGNEAALVGRAMRRRSVPSALLFSGAPNVDVLPEADRTSALEGALFPCVFADQKTDATGGRFLEAFAARHATQPNERACLGYAAGRRILDGLLAAGSSAALDIRPALVAAHPITSLAVVRVEHGTFVRALPPQH